MILIVMEKKKEKYGTDFIVSEYVVRNQNDSTFNISVVRTARYSKILGCVAFPELEGLHCGTNIKGNLEVPCDLFVVDKKIYDPFIIDDFIIDGVKVFLARGTQKNWIHLCEERPEWNDKQWFFGSYENAIEIVR